MGTQYELPGDDEAAEGPSSEWTPARGVARGLAWGALAAVVLIGLTAPAAWYVPSLLLNWLIRAALGFLVAWVLFGIVQRGAGMVGWPITAIVIGLTCAVLISQHVIFMIHGVPDRAGGVIAGCYWLEPFTIAISNLTAFVTIAFCAALCHDGGAGTDTLVDLLRLRPWW